MSEPSKPRCHVGAARIGYRGRAGACVLDTTVKSGTGSGAVFAPTWELVMSFKRGSIAWETYRTRFIDLIRQRYLQNPEVFLEALQRQNSILCR